MGFGCLSKGLALGVAVASRRLALLKTGVSDGDHTVSLLSAVVCPGHPESNGIGGDGTGSLVHGTGVPVSEDARIPRALRASSRG